MRTLQSKIALLSSRIEWYSDDCPHLEGPYTLEDKTSDMFGDLKEALEVITELTERLNRMAVLASATHMKINADVDEHHLECFVECDCYSDHQIIVNELVDLTKPLKEEDTGSPL